MRWRSHSGFLLLLLGCATAVTIIPWIHGADYYLTPLIERPFHPQYAELKPSGLVGHGYGVIGSMMIIAGVALYSSRKRVRLLSGIGKLPRFLEIHIVLCLTGPILVLYHTTFKFGGLVSVSFWSMTAIVLSGIVGRYLYVQIPRGIQGHELSVTELDNELHQMSSQLTTDYGLSVQAIERIDGLYDYQTEKRNMGLAGTLWFLIADDLIRSRSMRSSIRALGLRRDATRALTALFRARHVLHRRILTLKTIGRLFHYWHVIHMPFSIIMLVILVVHVTVALALGYWWIP